jgi:hypothetical protein
MSTEGYPRREAPRDDEPKYQKRGAVILEFHSYPTELALGYNIRD